MTSISNRNAILQFISFLDAIGEAALDAPVPESIRDEEEEIIEEQKDDGKMGFCEIQ